MLVAKNSSIVIECWSKHVIPASYFFIVVYALVVNACNSSTWQTSREKSVSKIRHNIFTIFISVSRVSARDSSRRIAAGETQCIASFRLAARLNFSSVQFLNHELYSLPS